jgi:hypothetical protein
VMGVRDSIVMLMVLVAAMIITPLT